MITHKLKNKLSALTLLKTGNIDQVHWVSRPLLLLKHWHICVMNHGNQYCFNQRYVASGLKRRGLANQVLVFHFGYIIKTKKKIVNLILICVNTLFKCEKLSVGAHFYEHSYSSDYSLMLYHRFLQCTIFIVSSFLLALRHTT